MWIAASVWWRSPNRETVEARLDDVKLAVRDPERARTELLRDRQLGNSATSLINDVATNIT
jgi:hypothetical protein